MYSKNEILEQYLNTIYFGHGNYGIGSAAKYYFDKGPAELDAAEAALLGGIINGPYLFTPVRTGNVTPPYAPEDFDPNDITDVEKLQDSRTYRRRNFVLYRMLEQDFIDKKQI